LNALESKGAINFPRLIDCNTNPKFYGSGEMIIITDTFSEYYPIFIDTLNQLPYLTLLAKVAEFNLLTSVHILLGVTHV
jgi:hypothetical protein